MSFLDAVIVGAGPIGSYLAYKLADAGYEVLVLEKAEGLGSKTSCTGIIGRECVSSFPVEEHVILRWVNSARIFSPSGRSLRVFREEDQACIIDRRAFDRSMAEQAQDRGAQYRLGSPVRDVRVGGSGVTVEVSSPGEVSSYNARAVGVAAGFGSRNTEKLGLGTVGDFVMGAQAEVSTHDVESWTLRCQDPTVVQTPQAQRSKAVGIADSDDVGLVHEH